MRRRRRSRFNMRRSYRRRRDNKVIKILKVVLLIIIAVAIVYIGFVSAKFIQQLISGDVKTPPETPSFEASSETDEAADIKIKSFKSSLYVPCENIGQIGDVIKSAKEKNINNIIIEIKDSKGNLYYKTQNSAVLASGAVTENAVDLKQVADSAKKEKITIGVKIHCFKDNTAPRKIPEAGVGVRKGYLWLDGTNSRWLNPYYTEAVDYLTAIASDAVSSGVSEILLDSVEFPSMGKTAIIEYEINKPQKTKEQALIDFVKAVKAKAGEKADVGIFGEFGFISDKNKSDVKSGKSFSLYNSADFAAADFTSAALSSYKQALNASDGNIVNKALDKVKANIPLDRVQPFINENDYNIIVQNKCRGYTLNNITK